MLFFLRIKLKVLQYFNKIPTQDLFYLNGSSISVEKKHCTIQSILCDKLGLCIKYLFDDDFRLIPKNLLLVVKISLIKKVKLQYITCKN
jgi:hypothetical protein